MYRLLAAIALLCGLCTGHARAEAVEKVRTQFAHAVYEQSGGEINHDRPQAMLRALACVNRLIAEFEVSDGERRELQKNGFLEAWLFQNDGRFALKTLALPQRGL